MDKKFIKKLRSLSKEYPTLTLHSFYIMGIKYLENNDNLGFRQLMTSESDKIRGFPKFQKLLKIYGIIV